jgi:uncharacterized protein YndB with AHSA1/START domain
MTKDESPEHRDVTIRQSIWIDATPERVYRALTTRDELVHWFVSDIESEFREGADIRFEFASCNVTLAGRYLELEPDRRVVFLFDKSRVTFTLEPHDGGTRVLLINEKLPRDFDLAIGQSEGWAAYLCNLKVWIELDRDLRADQPTGTILPK